MRQVVRLEILVFCGFLLSGCVAFECTTIKYYAPKDALKTGTEIVKPEIKEKSVIEAVVEAITEPVVAIAGTLSEGFRTIGSVSWAISTNRVAQKQKHLIFLVGKRATYPKDTKFESAQEGPAAAKMVQKLTFETVEKTNEN